MGRRCCLRAEVTGQKSFPFCQQSNAFSDVYDCHAGDLQPNLEVNSGKSGLINSENDLNRKTAPGGETGENICKKRKAGINLDINCCNEDTTRRRRLHSPPTERHWRVDFSPPFSQSAYLVIFDPISSG